MLLIARIVHDDKKQRKLTLQNLKIPLTKLYCKDYKFGNYDKYLSIQVSVAFLHLIKISKLSFLKMSA